MWHLKCRIHSIRIDQLWAKKCDLFSKFVILTCVHCILPVNVYMYYGIGVCCCFFRLNQYIFVGAAASHLLHLVVVVNVPWSARKNDYLIFLTPSWFSNSILKRAEIRKTCQFCRATIATLTETIGHLIQSNSLQFDLDKKFVAVVFCDRLTRCIWSIDMVYIRICHMSINVWESSTPIIEINPQSLCDSH